MTRRAHGDDEEDAFSRYWRRVVRWRRGELTQIKRRAHKRERREGKREARR